MFLDYLYEDLERARRENLYRNKVIDLLIK